MTGAVAAIAISLVVIGVITWVLKRRSPARSTNRGHADVAAVHLPSDDPLWLEHSRRLVRRPRPSQRSRKIWAAGTVGSVGAGSIDPYGGWGGESSPTGDTSGGDGCGGDTSGGDTSGGDGCGGDTSGGDGC